MPVYPRPRTLMTTAAAMAVAALAFNLLSDDPRAEARLTAEDRAAALDPEQREQWLARQFVILTRLTPLFEGMAARGQTLSALECLEKQEHSLVLYQTTVTETLAQMDQRIRALAGEPTTGVSAAQQSALTRGRLHDIKVYSNLLNKLCP